MFSDNSNVRKIIPVLARGRGKGDECEYGIYHADREYALEVGDPMLAVVRAKSAAEAQIMAKDYSQVTSEVIAVTDNVQVARKIESEFSLRSGSPVSEASMREHTVTYWSTRRPSSR